MNQNEIYEFIGNLAIALHSKGLNISFSSLNTILAERDAAYDSNRGVAAGVSAAFRYWEAKQDLAIAHSIALTFRDKDGKYAYEKE